MTAYIFIPFFLVVTSLAAIADGLPKNAQILARASTDCGSEDTYYVPKNSRFKSQDSDLLKWVLNFALTESPIGDFDFSETTGKEIAPTEFEKFIERDDSKKLIGKALRSKLRVLRDVRNQLNQARKTVTHSQMNVSQDPTVKSLVEKYWGAKRVVIHQLEKQFGVRIADTGANCD